MTMKARGIERVKSALIVLLIISAAFFAYKTDLYTPLRSEPENASEASASANETLPAAYPDAIAVTGALGGRYGAIYDSAEIDNLWKLTSATLGTALGTAGSSARVSDTTFRKALAGVGIYYHYRYPIPVSVLLKWLKVSGIREHNEVADLIFLAPNDSAEEDYTIAVYYRDKDGLLYKCDSSASMESLMPEINGIMSNGAFYPFESDSSNAVNPYILLPDNIAKLNTLTVSKSSVAAKDILNALGMNPYLHTSYQEGNDCTVYVEEAVLLRLYNDGRLEFKSERPVAVIDNSLSGSIERARKLLVAVTQSDALRLVSYKWSENGYELRFSYYFNGIEIKPGNAATVTVKNGAVTDLRMSLHSYAVSEDEEVLLLPPRQAIAASGDENGTLYIVYAESGDRAIPIWLKS
ncbi:MAG: hypothetical protein LBC38_03755 [Oscillospiraceae bacterium]|jgi:hypothetical protein|nr:hypothetical protein [Oscillospiraceae bacterium]